MGRKCSAREWNAVKNICQIHLLNRNIQGKWKPSFCYFLAFACLNLHNLHSHRLALVLIHKITTGYEFEVMYHVYESQSTLVFTITIIITVIIIIIIVILLLYYFKTSTDNEWIKLHLLCFAYMDPRDWWSKKPYILLRNTPFMISVCRHSLSLSLFKNVLQGWQHFLKHVPFSGTCQGTHSWVKLWKDWEFLQVVSGVKSNPSFAETEINLLTTPMNNYLHTGWHWLLIHTSCGK